MQTSATMKSRLPFLACLLVVFLVVFPKGGIKAGDIPLTWGYILLALLAVPATLASLPRFSWGSRHAGALLMALPFPLLAILTINTNGYISLGYYISSIVTFLLLPVFFLLSYKAPLEDINEDRLLNLIKNAVVIVAVYGIALFFLKMSTGESFSIPYLTVNADELEDVFTKNNDRGGVFKLISTYNNGNIFGVCMLMLLPLVSARAKWWQSGTVKMSIILTLSRTAWAGLVAYELLNLMWGKASAARKRALITTMLVGIPFMAIGIFYALSLFSGNYEGGFLFDSNLGGRVSQLDILDDWQWLGDRPYFAISEMVYFSVLANFGAFGLLFFLFWLASPLLARWPFPTAKLAPTQHQAMLGMVIYMAVAFSDGAIMLIPVMAIYWFLAALYLREPKTP